MKKFLLTGFEAFAEQEINPTELLMNDLQEQGYETLVLPVSFKHSWKILKTKIESLRPDFIISTGVARNRETIDLERVALNFKDASIKDNDGSLYQEEVITKNGPPCFISDFPLNKWKSELERDFPVSVSLSAGSYVCNYIYYQLLVNAAEYHYQSVFVHFPYPKTVSNRNDYQSFMKKLIHLIDSSN